MAKRNSYAGGTSHRAFGLAGLSEGDIEHIHLTTLEVLERTGVWVEADDAMDVFADGGCRVDRETHTVKIPPHVVEDAIASAPSRVTLCGSRGPEQDVVLEPGRVGFTTFCEGIVMHDPWTGERRDTTKKDAGDIGLLADYLDEIDTYQVAVVSRDVPDETYELHNLEAGLLNCTKPLGVGPFAEEDQRLTVEIARVVAGGADALRERPMIYLTMGPVSPLQLPAGTTTSGLHGARAGVPCTALTMAMAGGSAPATLAGVLVTHNAEVLSVLTLVQLAERGNPFIYGSSTTALDLRNALAAVGSPECGMISAGVAQIARHYRLPSFVAGL